MKPQPGAHPGQSYSLRGVAKPVITAWRTMIFMLASLHILIGVTLYGLGISLANQAVMITQQEAILIHCRVIENMLFDDRDTLREKQLGRSYLHSRPAAEIDRIIDRTPAYLPRAP